MSEASGPDGLRGWIRNHSRARPGAIAIAAPARAPLSFAQLDVQIGAVLNDLADLGINRSDRIATVLPDGPEMATASVALLCGSTLAPLNPALTEAEIDFALSDLGVKVLLTQAGFDSPARVVATRLGLSVFEIVPLDVAGLFDLHAGDLPQVNPEEREADARIDDVALVLHTSGTTSRPKVVPLSERNLLASVRNHLSVLKLTERDRCLNVMPLFHVHGLVSVLLTSLAAGGSVVCPPGFDAESFFGWVDEFMPTWYTASPTIHIAVREQSRRCLDRAARSSFRFIRSAAAPLPPTVMSDLERTFRVPVVESYGMTEAAAQITSNPLPPGQRIAGSVGVASGPEVAVMDATGELLESGETGEIVIRGESVTSGYEKKDATDETRVPGGWLRTGDTGRMNADGYLFLVGRLKEMISRGGKKVAPREVNEVLIEHPAVDEVVTFSYTHASLGEDIVSAVVLKSGCSAAPEGIRALALKQLAGYKVPSEILIVDAIPKSATGKPQTRVLADAFVRRRPFGAPRNTFEQTLASIWEEVLNVDSVGTDDNFFLLGGDSIQATLVINRILRRWGVSVGISAIFESPTLAAQAGVIRSLDDSETSKID